MQEAYQIELVTVDHENNQHSLLGQSHWQKCFFAQPVLACIIADNLLLYVFYVCIIDIAIAVLVILHSSPWQVDLTVHNGSSGTTQPMCVFPI
jgi:hypothetical protein